MKLKKTCKECGKHIDILCRVDYIANATEDIIYKKGSNYIEIGEVIDSGLDDLYRWEDEDTYTTNCGCGCIEEITEERAVKLLEESLESENRVKLEE